jgi:hypothetical protein
MRVDRAVCHSFSLTFPSDAEFCKWLFSPASSGQATIKAADGLKPAPQIYERT